MSSEVLIRNGDKANWGTDSAPIDPERLPEGYPYKEQGWVASSIQNQVFRFREEDGKFLSGFPGANFVFGDPYKITWDGTDYICTAVEMQGAVCIGNATVVGGSGNDEPFLMIAQGYSTTIAALVGGAEHTISLSFLSEIIHPMSDEFLPTATPTAAGAMKQAAAVTDVTAAPTAEEFNALLKSLRDAGILATS